MVFKLIIFLFMNIIKHFWIKHIMSKDIRVFLKLLQKTFLDLRLIVHHEVGYFSAFVHNNHHFGRSSRIEHVWLFLVFNVHEISMGLIFYFLIFFLFHFFNFLKVQKLLFFLKLELFFFLLSLNCLNFKFLFSFLMIRVLTFCSFKNILYISRQFLSLLLFDFDNHILILFGKYVI